MQDKEKTLWMLSQAKILTNKYKGVEISHAGKSRIVLETTQFERGFLTHMGIITVETVGYEAQGISVTLNSKALTDVMYSFLGAGLIEFVDKLVNASEFFEEGVYVQRVSKTQEVFSLTGLCGEKTRNWLIDKGATPIIENNSEIINGIFKIKIKAGGKPHLEVSK